jgi:carbon monoxide dehydrogenase subunit G
MRFSNSIYIQRPRAEVFAFLATPENLPRWNHAIDAARLVTPEPLGVGSRIEQHRTEPRPATEELEVTEFSADRRLGLRGDLGPLHGVITYDLETADEGTHLTNAADLDASGPFRLVAPLASSRIRDAVADNLRTLKNLLEAGEDHVSAS